MKSKVEITYDDIKKFEAKHGKQGVKTLSMLGKGSPFDDAIRSNVGQVLLQDIMIEMEILLEKIIADKASEKDKADYRSYRKIFIRWTKKISDYDNLKSKVKGEPK